MPKPAHLRYTFRGIVGPVSAPIDDWSFSINALDFSRDPATFNAVDPIFTGFSDAQQDAVATAMRTAWTTNMNLFYDPTVTLTECRVAAIDALGLTKKRADGSFQQGIDTTVATGQSGLGPVYPPQIALVISLQTARQGASGKGRFFAPNPNLVLGADKLLPVQTQELCLTKFGDFLRDLNAIGFNLVVASSLGFLSPVTGLRVGRALDTMRSRRSEMVESYLSAALR